MKDKKIVKEVDCTHLAPPVKPICGRCYDEVDKVFPTNCAEKPEMLRGQPIGQYHCPDCGAMVLAGVSHPPLCLRCLNRCHPAFDVCEGGCE